MVKLLRVQATRPHDPTRLDYVHRRWKLEARDYSISLVHPIASPSHTHRTSHVRVKFIRTYGQHVVPRRQEHAVGPATQSLLFEASRGPLTDTRHSDENFG